VFGCDLLDELADQGLIKDDESQLAICAKWGFYMKEMYRSNYISPQLNCETDQDLSFEGTECGYICLDVAAEGRIPQMHRRRALGLPRLPQPFQGVARIALIRVHFPVITVESDCPSRLF
jgi:hypothetical protein